MAAQKIDLLLDGLWTEAQVEAFVGIPRRKLREMSEEGKFPQRCFINQKRQPYVPREVADWVEAQKAKRPRRRK